MQNYLDPKDHDLPSTPLIKYSGHVNVPADEVDGWERLPAETESSLGPFLSTCISVIDSMYVTTYGEMSI